MIHYSYTTQLDHDEIIYSSSCSWSVADPSSLQTARGNSSCPRLAHPVKKEDKEERNEGRKERKTGGGKRERKEKEKKETTEKKRKKRRERKSRPPIRLLPSDPTLRRRPPALCSPHAHHPFPLSAQPVSSARSPISLWCTARPQTGLAFWHGSSPYQCPFEPPSTASSAAPSTGGSS